MQIIISKSNDSMVSDPDALEGLEFDDFVLPIFLPKAQQIFIREMKRIETIVALSQVVKVQCEFI